MKDKSIKSMLFAIYNNVESAICIVCFLFALTILFYQTVSRYFFHASASWPEEVATYLLVWLTYFSASFTMQKKAHITVDAVMYLYPKKVRKYIDLLAYVIWLALSVFLTVVNWQYTMGRMEIAATGIALYWLPIWVVYLAIPVGHFFLCLRLLEVIIQYVKDMISGKLDAEADKAGVSAEVAEMIEEMKKMEEGGANE